MRRFLAYILTASLLLMAGCSGRYEEDWKTLRLSSTEYNLSREGGSFQFMVYYSSSWNAELRADDTSWLVLSRTSADGQAYIRVTYDSATDEARAAYIDITAGDGDRQTVTLNQSAR